MADGRMNRRLFFPSLLMFGAGAFDKAPPPRMNTNWLVSQLLQAMLDMDKLWRHR